MSQNSSKKKNSITSLDEYYQLSQLYSDAWDRVRSGGQERDTAVFIMKSLMQSGDTAGSPTDGKRRWLN